MDSRYFKSLFLRQHFSSAHFENAYCSLLLTLPPHLCCMLYFSSFLALKVVDHTYFFTFYFMKFLISHSAYEKTFYFFQSQNSLFPSLDFHPFIHHFQNVLGIWSHGSSLMPKTLFRFLSKISTTLLRYPN